MASIREKMEFDGFGKITKIFIFCAFFLALNLRAEETEAPTEDKNLKEEYKTLLMGKDKISQGERKVGMKIEIEEVNLPAPVPKTSEKFPIPPAKIEEGCFYKNNLPSYFIGAEVGLNQYPFLYKVLGLDILQFTGGEYLNNILRESKEGDTVKISWRYPKETDLVIREILENGFLAYVQQIEDERKCYPLLDDNFKDLLVTYGHFYIFRHDIPDAWKIRENARKISLAAAAKYPVFAYELFNEVGFTDYGPEALKRFRSEMEAKYSSIGSANKIWKTAFKNFQEVNPPLKGGGGDSSFTILGKKVSRMLWLDWLKFSERNSAESFKKTYDLVKKYDPGAYLTTQTHCQYFYDYGAHGVNPFLKSKTEDFYGDESGFTYYTQLEGYEDVEKINRMLRNLMWLDYLSNIVPDKPQVSEETSIGGAYVDIKKLPRVLDLHNGDWKFISDNKEEGLKLGYWKADYDDSSWKNITVPDMWANQGYEKTSFAWYRYHFKIPEKYSKQQIYLNAKELADTATVYINGEKIYKTKKYNEQFGIDISKYLKLSENVLAIGIKNDYFQANRYWGGIRGGISLDLENAGEMIPMNYGQMRSFFWERALHGEAGVFPSYIYSPEGYRQYSVFNPEKIRYDALKGLPKAKAEINSVGKIVLTKKPRRDGVIALVYPLENMRYHIHKVFSDMIAGPLIYDLSKWYAGLLFSGVPLSVVSNDYILGKNISKYRAVFMRGNDRVPGKLMEKLRKYVSDGGVLVIDDSSLMKEEDSDKNLSAEDFLGCKRLSVVKEQNEIDLSSFKMGTVNSGNKKRDASGGTLLELKGGKSIASDEKQRAAIVLNNFGKGKVYTIGRELPENETNKLLQAILKKEGISPEIQLSSSKNLPYVEKHLLGEKGSYLLYLHNWGGGVHDVSIKIPGNLLPGNYNIRNLETGKAIVENISVQDLKEKGIKIELQSQTATALIIEEKNLKPLAIDDISEEQRKWLDYICRPSPKNVPLEKRILIDSAHINQYSRIHLLTAAKALEDKGYEVNITLSELTEKTMKTYTDHIGLEELSDYGIFFMGGISRIEIKEADKLIEWVKNGGSLFICGNWFRGPHGWLSNYSVNSKLYSKLGALVENNSFEDGTNNLNKEAMYPVFSNIAESKITKGVKDIYSQGMAVLNLKAPEWQALVKGNKTSNYPDKPAIAVRTFGKGKIVLCGDAAWLKPTLLGKGDNMKLLINLMNWLAVKD